MLDSYWVIPETEDDIEHYGEDANAKHFNQDLFSYADVFTGLQFC